MSGRIEVGALAFLSACTSVHYPFLNRDGLEALYARHAVGAADHRPTPGTPLVLPDPQSAEARRLPPRTFLNLTRGQATQANFGGRFQIISWGCGTSCITGVIVSVDSGRILSTLPTCEWDREFRLTSLLFVENPPDPSAGENRSRPPWARPIYHVWDGHAFRLLYDTGRSAPSTRATNQSWVGWPRR